MKVSWMLFLVFKFELHVTPLGPRSIPYWLKALSSNCCSIFYIIWFEHEMMKNKRKIIMKVHLWVTLINWILIQHDFDLFSFHSQFTIYVHKRVYVCTRFAFAFDIYWVLLWALHIFIVFFAYLENYYLFCIIHFLFSSFFYFTFFINKIK